MSWVRKRPDSWLELTAEDGMDGLFDHEGTHWDSELDYVQIGILGLCGCTDDRIAEFLFDCLETPKLLLGTDTGDEHWRREMALCWLNNLDLIEHGASERFSWRTKHGNELLVFWRKAREEAE